MPRKLHHHDITGISAKLNDIADWLICNPGKGQKGKCAEAFNISQSWLSTLTNTDSFRDLMEMKQNACFEEVTVPIKARLLGVAERGLERLGEVLDTTQDERLVHDIAKTSMQLAGYGANKAAEITVQHNDNSVHNTQVNNVNAEALAAARKRAGQHYTKEKALEDSSQPVNADAQASETKGLPNGLPSDFGMGETREVRPEIISEPTQVHGTEKEGDSL